MTPRPVRISAVDLFCGVGGLSYGLQEAGIRVGAGVDLDDSCRYPYETNIGSKFHHLDVCDLQADDLTPLWTPGSARVLAGCAPCQPFSPHRRGADTSSETQWRLVEEMGRLVKGALPEIVTMENVPRIISARVFERFVALLRSLGYHVASRSCYCPTYGIPQHRRRLVLVASLLGEIKVPDGTVASTDFVTVRQAIGDLPAIKHGHEDPKDRIHKSRTLSATNLKRIKRAVPGGTWEQWPDDLKSPCHRRSSGATFRNVYARMAWDEPSPTITTMAYNFGTGRFGHPEQDRPISLREAAILQSFPHDYKLVAPEAPVQFLSLGRHIGNAVPPMLAEAVGTAIVDHVKSIKGSVRRYRRKISAPVRA